MYKPLLLLGALALSTQAQEKTHVHSHGGTGQCVHSKDQFFTGHLHSTNHFDFNAENQEVLKTHTHFDFLLNFNENISIFTGLKLEQDHSHGHDDHGGGGGHDEEDHSDQYFEDHVMYLEQLYLDLTFTDQLSLQAGKMNLPIGFGLHEYMGYYGYEVQEEIALREKIAFNLRWRQELDNGAELSLNASTFFTDTTINDSFFDDREGAPKNLHAAGPANTEDFSSYALGARLDNLYYMTGDYIHEFTLLAGFALQAEAKDSDEHGDDEERWLAGAKYTLHFDENTSVTFLHEFIDIASWGAENEADLISSNWGAQANYFNWRFGGTYTDYYHDHEEADEENNGRALQVSAGYFFDNGISVELGYQKIKEPGEDEDNEGPGIAVSYSLEF